MPTVAAPHPTQRETGRAGWGQWPLERILFALAGTMTGLSAVLSALVSPWFLLLTGFVAFFQPAALRHRGELPGLAHPRHAFGVGRRVLPMSELGPIDLGAWPPMRRRWGLRLLGRWSSRWAWML